VWGRSYEEVKCFEWHKWSIEGHDNVEVDGNSGHPRFHRTDESVEKMWNRKHWDRRLSIRFMTVQLNLDKETVRKA
jgi:hypothetical protein